VAETGLGATATDAGGLRPVPTYIHTRLERVNLDETGLMSADYSNLGMDLLATLEKYLEVFVEYHVRGETDEWHRWIGADPERGASIGELAGFFTANKTEATLELSCLSTAAAALTEPVVDDFEIVEFRNDLDHAHIDFLDEAAYDELKTRVMAIIDATVPELPVLVTPRSKTEIGGTYVYSVTIHRARPRKRAWIEIDVGLTTDELYVIGPDAFPHDDSSRWEVPVDSLRPCTAERAREAI
jgi:hypothetical protein